MDEGDRELVAIESDRRRLGHAGTCPACDEAAELVWIDLEQRRQRERCTGCYDEWTSLIV